MYGPTKTLGQLHPHGILKDLITRRSLRKWLESCNSGMEILRYNVVEAESAVAPDFIGIFWVEDGFYPAVCEKPKDTGLIESKLPSWPWLGIQLTCLRPVSIRFFASTRNRFFACA